jgi:Mating-type protein beta 1
MSALLSGCSSLDSYLHSHNEPLEDETLDMLEDFSLPIDVLAPHMAELSMQKEASMRRFSADMIEILEDKTSKLSLNDTPRQGQSLCVVVAFIQADFGPL